MKRIAGLLILIAGAAFAQAPSCTQVVGPFYTDSPSGQILMNGTVQLALNYTSSSSGIFIGNSLIRAAITAGAINPPANYVCLTPGTWTATYTLSGTPPQPPPFNRTWTILPSGGPYTRAQVESATPPNPPIILAGATSPLVWSPLTLTLSLPAASGSQNGYLASSDWTKFNSAANLTNLVLVSAGATTGLLSVGNGAANLAAGQVGTVGNDVAIGPGATNLSTGVGGQNPGALTTVLDSVAIGYHATNARTGGFDGAATQAVAIGSGSSTSWRCGIFTNSGPVVVGYGSEAGCWNTIVIGANNLHFGADSIAIGANISGSRADSILMGRATLDNGFAGTAIGNHAFLTADGQYVIGGDQDTTFGGIRDVFIGPPATNWSQQGTNAPQAMSLNPCGGGLGSYGTGSGSNFGGCNLSINGGRSTGNAAGGALFFKTNSPGASGASQNPLVVRFSIEDGYPRTPSHTPASSSEACLAGDSTWDATYEYRCVSTNTWQRSTRSTF